MRENRVLSKDKDFVSSVKARSLSVSLIYGKITRNMLKGIIFDLDGTITLTEILHNKAFARIFKEYGIDFSYEEQVAKYAGSGSRNIFKKVFEDRGFDFGDEEIEKRMGKKKILYKKIVQESEIEVVPGAREFVKKIHEKGLKKIIATGNSDLEIVRFILEKIGLSEYFPELLSITEVARGKPFPDVFIEAAKRMGLEPEQCVVLEDSINGVTAAKAASMRCIALETTTEREKLLAAGAFAVVKDYTEITDAILYGNIKNL